MGQQIRYLELSSSSAKKGIAPCSLCRTIAGFQINQLLVKIGQDQPTREASLNCCCTIQRHDRDREPTRNADLNHDGEEISFRTQAQLPLSHDTTTKSFQEVSKFFICYPRQRVKWLHSNSHWDTPPLQWYFIQRAWENKYHVTSEQKSSRKTGAYITKIHPRFGLTFQSYQRLWSKLSAKHFVWSFVWTETTVSFNSPAPRVQKHQLPLPFTFQIF